MHNYLLKRGGNFATTKMIITLESYENFHSFIYEKVHNVVNFWDYAAILRTMDSALSITEYLKATWQCSTLLCIFMHFSQSSPWAQKESSSTLQHLKIEHTYLSNSKVGVSKSGDWPLFFLLIWLTSVHNTKHLMIQTEQDFDTSYFLLYQLGLDPNRRWFCKRCLPV